MAEYKPKSSGVIYVTREDLESYKNKDPMNRGSLKDFIKEQMEPVIPDYQDIDIELKEDLNHIDLSDCDLSGLKIENKELLDVDLSGANLSGAEITGGRIFANFARAKLFDAKFYRVDFTQSDFHNIIVNDNTYLWTTRELQKKAETWLERGKQAIASTGVPISEYEGCLLSDDAEVAQNQKTQIENAKILDKLLTDKSVAQVKKEFDNRNKLGMKDVQLLNMDNSMLVCRFALAKDPEDTTAIEYLEFLKNEQIKRIKNEVSSKIWKKQSWSTWAKGFAKKNAVVEHITDSITNIITSDDDFLKNHFLFNADKEGLGNYLDKITPNLEGFLQDSKREKLKENEIKEKFDKSATKEFIVKDINQFKEEIRSEHREDGIKNLAGNVTAPPKETTRLERLQEELKKTGKKHFDKVWPSAFRPDVRSSFPAIDPNDEEALANDLALKAEGLKLLASIGAMSGGLAAGNVAGGYLATMGVPSMLSGYLTPAIAYTASGAIQSGNDALVEYLKKEENRPLLEGQLGDRLLECGLYMRHAVKPFSPNLNTPSATALIQYLASGPLSFTGMTVMSSTPGMIGTTAAGAMAYAAYKNAVAVRAAITEEKDKDNFMKRNRPGSEEFTKELDKKLVTEKMKRALITGIPAAIIVVGVAVASIATFGAGGIAAGLLTTPFILGASAVTGAVASAAAFYYDNQIVRVTSKIKDWFSKKGSSQSQINKAPSPTVSSNKPEPEIQKGAGVERTRNQQGPELQRETKKSLELPREKQSGVHTRREEEKRIKKDKERGP